MLANSFSHLPIKTGKEKGEEQWHFVSDLEIAIYLRENEGSHRKSKLAEPLEKAVFFQHLKPAIWCAMDAPLSAAVSLLNGLPLLVGRNVGEKEPPVDILDKAMSVEHVDKEMPVGILTAFDLL